VVAVLRPNLGLMACLHCKSTWGTRSMTSISANSAPSHARYDGTREIQSCKITSDEEFQMRTSAQFQHNHQDAEPGMRAPSVSTCVVAIHVRLHDQYVWDRSSAYPEQFSDLKGSGEDASPPGSRVKIHKRGMFGDG